MSNNTGGVEADLCPGPHDVLVDERVGGIVRVGGPRTENPDHDSLFARFEQLDGLLWDLEHADDRDRDTARDARAVLTLIRAQVLK